MEEFLISRNLPSSQLFLPFWRSAPFKSLLDLTIKVHFTKIVAFVASVAQDQAAQNVQPGILSTLSAVVIHYRQTVAVNLQ